MAIALLKACHKFWPTLFSKNLNFSSASWSSQYFFLIMISPVNPDHHQDIVPLRQSSSSFWHLPNGAVIIPHFGPYSLNSRSKQLFQENLIQIHLKSWHSALFPGFCISLIFLIQENQEKSKYTITEKALSHIVDQDQTNFFFKKIRIILWYRSISNHLAMEMS